MSDTTTIKYDLLKTELQLTQHEMDKYDQQSLTTKTWSVTLWVAIIGWAIQSHLKTLALVGVIIVILFWLFDGTNRKFRRGYKNRRDEVSAALETYSRSGEIADSVSSPHLPSHKEVSIFSDMLVIHVGLPYFTLIILSIIVCFLI